VNRLDGSWTRWRLDEIADAFPGAWGSDEPSPSTVEYRVLGVGNVGNDGSLKLEGATYRHLRRNDLGAIANEGDLLVVKSSGSAQNIRSGKTAICPPELSGTIACSNFMLRLVVNRKIADPYLVWLLLNSHAAKDFVQRIAGSSTYPNIKWQQLRSFELELPDLPKQALLVAGLRERLAAVKQTRTELIAQVQAAEALPAAFLRAAFASPSAARWPRCKLADIIRKPLRTGLSKQTSNSSAVRCLTLSSVRDGRLDVSASKPIDATDREIAQNQIQSGAFYVVRGNGNISLVARGGLVLSKTETPILFPDLLIEVIPRSELMLPSFLRWIWDAPATRQSLEKRSMTSAGIYKINLTNLSTIDLPVPPIPEQGAIAEQLNSEFENTRSLRAHLTEELAAVEKLPAALLRQAFNGQS
jgi:type I restriction enzyme S subunit